jgi:hypothetical protein
MSSTQLTEISNCDVSNIVFSTPITNTIPNSIPKVTYKRVNILTKYPNGRTGDLVLCTENLFSYGVSENKNQETGKVNGYSLPLCLWNRDNVSKEEKEFTDKFNEIVDHIKQYLITNRNELEQYDLEASDLKKFNPMYWKRDRNGVVAGTGPSLYPKLIVSKKDNTERIISQFYDKNTGDKLEPMSLMGKYCFVKVAIKIESIFVGNKLSLQIKVWEAEIELLDKGMKRLLSTPVNSVESSTDSKNYSNNNVIDNEVKVEVNEQDDDDVSLYSDSDSETNVPITTVKTQPGVVKQIPETINKMTTKRKTVK